MADACGPKWKVLTRQGKRTANEGISNTIKSPSKKKRTCQSRKEKLETNTFVQSEKEGGDTAGSTQHWRARTRSAKDTCSNSDAGARTNCVSVPVTSKVAGVVQNGTEKEKLKKPRKETTTVPGTLSQTLEVEVGDSSLEPLRPTAGCNGDTGKGKQSVSACKVSKASAYVKENSTCNKNCAATNKMASGSTSKTESSSSRKLTKKAIIETLESLSDDKFLQFTLPRMFKLLTPGEYLWKRCERKKDHKVTSSAIVFSQFTQLRNLVQKRLRKVLQEEKEVMTPIFKHDGRSKYSVPVTSNTTMDIPNTTDCTTTDDSVIPTLESTAQSNSSHVGVLESQVTASSSSTRTSIVGTEQCSSSASTCHSFPVKAVVPSSQSTPRQPEKSSTCLLPHLFTSPKTSTTAANQVMVQPIHYAIEKNGILEQRVTYFNPSGYNNKKMKPVPVVSEEEVLQFLENRPKEATRLVLKAKDIWKTSLLAGHILPLFFQRNPEPFEDFTVQLALSCSITFTNLQRLKQSIGKKLQSATGINVIVISQKVLTDISVVRGHQEEQRKSKAAAIKVYKKRMEKIIKDAEERKMQEYQTRLQIKHDTEVLNRFMREQREQSQDPAVEVSEELDSSDDTDDEGLQLDGNEGLTLDGRSLRALISPDKIKKEPCSDDETSPPTFSIVNAMEEIAAKPSNDNCCLNKCKKEPADNLYLCWQ